MITHSICDQLANGWHVLTRYLGCKDSSDQITKKKRHRMVSTILSKVVTKVSADGVAHGGSLVFKFKFHISKSKNSSCLFGSMECGGYGLTYWRGVDPRSRAHVLGVAIVRDVWEPDIACSGVALVWRQHMTYKVEFNPVWNQNV